MTKAEAVPIPPSLEEVRAVSPALAHATESTLLGDLWKRPGLSPRDRSIVTLAVLVTKNQTIEEPFHVRRALDNGVKPGEISELLLHLAFYSGWANATAAVPIVKAAFDERGIRSDQLPPAAGDRLPLDHAAEEKRATTVEASFGAVAPGVVTFTSEALFHDLWLRPGLAPRDRSLVTVAALVASGQVAQIPYHLNRALDNGLTESEVGEVLTQLAFYAGWPNVFTALPIVKDTLEKRAAAKAD